MQETGNKTNRTVIETVMCQNSGCINVRTEFEKCLMFLANNYPKAYADYKSHLKPVGLKFNGE